MLSNNSTAQSDAYPSISNFQYSQGLGGSVNVNMSAQQGAFQNPRRHQPMMQANNLQPGLSTPRQQPAPRTQLARHHIGPQLSARSLGPQLTHTNPITASPNAGSMRSGQPAPNPGSYSVSNLSSRLHASNANAMRSAGQPMSHSGVLPGVPNAANLGAELGYGHAQTQHMQQLRTPQYPTQQQPLGAPGRPDHMGMPFDSLASNAAPMSAAMTSSGMFMSQAHLSRLQQQHSVLRTHQRAEGSDLPYNLLSQGDMAARRDPRVRVAQGPGVGLDNKEMVLDNDDFPALGLRVGEAGQHDAAGAAAAAAASSGAPPPSGSATAAAAAQHSAMRTRSSMLPGAVGTSDASDFPALKSVQMPSLPVGQGIADKLGRAGGMGGDSGAGGSAPTTARRFPAPGSGASDDSENFLLRGLLPVLRTEDKDVTLLSVGMDLQQLGQNLDGGSVSSAALLGQATQRSATDGVNVPQYYLFERPKLTPAALNRFSVASVLWVFYMFAGEENQVLAAEELIKRGWLFHKVFRVWMKSKNTQPARRGYTSGEHGAFEYFDPQRWRIEVENDFFLEEKDVEAPPAPAGAAELS